MEQDNNQEELELHKENEINSIPQQHEVDEQISANKVSKDDASQTYKYSQSQLQWMNRQVCNLERELLLNNSTAGNNFISNWTKVILSALSVLIPGIGQIIGIIIGLVFVSDDINSDKRSFGAALLTVSVVAFIISVCFWFIFALTFGPQLYY